MGVGNSIAWHTPDSATGIAHACKPITEENRFERRPPLYESLDRLVVACASPGGVEPARGVADVVLGY